MAIEHHGHGLLVEGGREGAKAVAELFDNFEPAIAGKGASCAARVLDGYDRVYRSMHDDRIAAIRRNVLEYIDRNRVFAVAAAHDVRTHLHFFGNRAAEAFHARPRVVADVERGEEQRERRYVFGLLLAT
jgi:hypothetical protein